MASSERRPDGPECGALDRTAATDRRLILLSPKDNVYVACTHLGARDTVVIDGTTVILAESIPLGHKLARGPIRAGERIVKYGAPIGLATADIAAGAHVHLHNLKSGYIPSFGMDAIESSAGGRGQ